MQRLLTLNKLHDVKPLLTQKLENVKTVIVVFKRNVFAAAFDLKLNFSSYFCCFVVFCCNYSPALPNTSKVCKNFQIK